ncbi:DMT family transporter [Roseisalinus antarcticus]|uniref:EamA-like transporter family protein n=1 Tax=Roseisalinus antarcticus TaxID=254357 RepID=A0A1Y5SUB0_9RHOB|nr:DMT family transporter [Roseisalinus antarcticus]SLN48022.1 EamA-like transporter family protein [Roseisalinus antarcticus]
MTARDRPGAAIAVMCTGALLLVLSDTASKWLVVRYHPMQILFVRSLVAMIVLGGIILIRSGPVGLRSARPGVHVLRGLCAIGATWAFILSLRFLALDAATALIFAAPLFIAALSWPVLREVVSRDRWIAVAVGFVGVMVIVRPGAASFEPALLLPIVAAALYALMMLSARRIDPRDGYLTMTFYMALVPAVICSATLLMSWPKREPLDLWLLAAVALCGTLGISLLSQAFRMAPAAIVAPFDYTALLWASVMGWIVWGTVPSVWIYPGAAVIVGSGLYLIMTERRAARAAARAELH